MAARKTASTKAARTVKLVKAEQSTRSRAAPKEKTLQQKFGEKIKESKISEAQAKKLGFLLMETARCSKELPEQAGGFTIPYFDLNGKKTTFYRYRYLESPRKSGFAGLAKKKDLRYGQPRNSVNELYLPPLVDWRAVAKDKTLPLIITEGELKAACGTAHTPYPTIGLGGVWCWKSNKARQPMLAQFDQFEWEGRPVYIVYDSDAKTNPMVIQAENALAQALTARGAEPYVARLPALDDGKKCGLDDFLLYNSVADLEELLENAEPWRAALELHKLNEEVIYVQDPGFVVKVNTLQKMAPHAFIGHHYATRIFWEENVAANGKVTLVKKVAAKEWISWPLRAEVNRMTYAPGDERITDKGELNVWPGWNCEPEEGDVTLWNQLLDHLFAGKAAERQWFERWLAWPLQHPGDKMFTSVLMWGLKHGTGKSMIGYSMKQIYGSNWVELKDRHLENDHNEWAENKQFCMGDEIMIGDKRGMSDRMKGLITQEDVRINAKFIPTYVVPDRINYYFTSNHPDSFFIEDDDRRMFIHEVVNGGMPDEFYTRYEKWMRADKWDGAKGPSALFAHLLKLDLGDFNPRARAPMTAAKADMLSTGRSEMGDWVARLRDSPDSVLRLGMAVLPYALWRVEDLVRLFDPEQRSKVTANGFARELRRAGFCKVAEGASVPTKTDGQVRLWEIRSIPNHVRNSQAEAAIYYDNERNIPAKRSKVR